MDAHDRYMGHRPADMWLMLREMRQKSPTMSDLVNTFNTFVSNVTEGGEGSRMNLDTLRTILCTIYQAKLLCKAVDTLDYQFNCAPLKKLSVNNAQTALYTQQWNAKDLSLVLDVLVLRMTLYSSLADIMSHLKELLNLIHQHLEKENELKMLDVRLMDCYMDSYLLNRKIYFTCSLDGEEVTALFLKNVQLWMKRSNHQDCQLLTLLLPKFIHVVKSGMQPSRLEGEILTQVWEMFFTPDNDPGKTLSMLCLTAGTWFPTDVILRCDLLIQQLLQEPLWLLLLKGLSSPTPQQRKEALTLLRRIVDFIEKWKGGGFDIKNYGEIRPLVCAGDDLEKDAFKKNLNNYFLIFEALEENQQHLVAPLFSLQTLVGETFGQQNHETGLHPAWVRCAFLRILQHDNNGVVKQGLLNVFSLGSELYNDEFLSKVLAALNNTFRYEKYAHDEEPIVVRELIRFLSDNETDLLTSFVVRASKMAWNPVALFYFIHALSMVKKGQSIWKKPELEAVRSLAEIISTMDCPMLRIGSQIELLETVTHFTTESLDLIAVAETLSVFPVSEALIRGQLVWKRTSAWLSKLVKVDEAISFLEKTCIEMTDENSQKRLSTKSLALMIMLFYDGHLIFDSKQCPGITALRNSLNCLIGTNLRSNANAESKNRSIELIHHLLDLTSLEDSIVCELISNYSDACLRYTFKNLRHVPDNAVIENIDTYISVTQQFFTAESSIIDKHDVLNYIERFEIETRNVIEDEEWSNHVRRFFGIKVLHACLNATSAKLKNYKFIGPLCNTYRTLTQRSSDETEKANRSPSGNENPQDKIASEYYKFVAKLLYDYVVDEPVDEWFPDINWIEEVLYLIQVGGADVFAPLVGILSQIFFKEVLKPTDIDDFKSVVRLCWNALESNECRSTTEEMMNLILSSPFLECVETRELTIECTRDMVDRGETNPELRIILLKGLTKVKGPYLCHFYDAILTCLLYGSVPDHERKIEHQACSYVLECYQDFYPNYLSSMNINDDAAIRAHAVTLLHRMITDDPTHAVKLLPIVYAKLIESQANQDLEDSQVHHRQNRIMQILLVLQPVLETVSREIRIVKSYCAKLSSVCKQCMRTLSAAPMDDIDSLLCDNVLCRSSQPGVRMMQQWLLIRIYLDEETFLHKIWDLFNQGPDSLCSVMTIVYHVARLLSSELQLDFINSAFQHISPYCMSHELNIRLSAQVTIAKLYDLASEKSLSIVTGKYKELYIAVMRSSRQYILGESTMLFMGFNPIDDYSLETLFNELPRLAHLLSDEYIPPQMFEKFGFKESNSHPLKLLNLRSDASEVRASDPVTNPSESTDPVPDDSDGSEDCCNEIQEK